MDYSGGWPPQRVAVSLVLRTGKSIMSVLLGHMQAARIIGEELEKQARQQPAKSVPGAASAMLLFGLSAAMTNAADRMQEQMRAQCGDGEEA